MYEANGWRVCRILSFAIALISFDVGATSICSKYESDLRFIAGEGTAVLTSYMSPKRGALDQTPSKEIGCVVNLKPSDREVVLVIVRERQPGLTFAESVRATREMYKRAGIKEKFSPEPQLGSEGFSLLTILALGRIAENLRVLGHTDSMAVNVSVRRGGYSRTPFSQAEIDRSRELVSKVLSEK